MVFTGTAMMKSKLFVISLTYNTAMLVGSEIKNFFKINFNKLDILW